MSLITQCPACSTMFRVVPDQLRISEGWVRCGQCDEVFDANAHLQTLQDAAMVPSSEASSDTAAPAPAATQTPLHDPASDSVSGYDWGAIVSEPPSVDFAGHLEYEEDPLQPPADPLYGSQFEVSVPPPALDYQPEADPFLIRSPVELPGPTGGKEPEMEPAVTAADDRSLQIDNEPMVGAPLHVDASADEVPLSFMPRKQQTSRFGRWLGAGALWSACALLAILLVGQVVVLERNRLAAVFPAGQPALQALCDVLKCKVSAPRQIEAIAIDSSTFTAVRSGVYALGVTLKSTGVYALETPALELTLTDMQDRPLMRRVFLASEYIAKPAVLSAGAELTVSVPVSVQAPDTAEKISGYKLLAFYP